MKKLLLSASLSGILLSGVALQAQMMQGHSMGKMFQSVSKEQATLLQKKDKLHCARCGMNLVKFYKTSHAAKDGDTTYQYCSIHCLAEHMHHDKNLKDPQVVDVHSLKFIPAATAHYVVGSDVKGTMSHESKYAFASLADAKKFQAKHGGKIADFHGALVEAEKDFK